MGRRHISTSGFAYMATETAVFALFFARTAQQSAIDGPNGSKPCAYCRIVWLELKPDSVLFVFITIRSLRPRNVVKYFSIVYHATTVHARGRGRWAVHTAVHGL